MTPEQAAREALIRGRARDRAMELLETVKVLYGLGPCMISRDALTSPDGWCCTHQSPAPCIHERARKLVGEIERP